MRKLFVIAVIVAISGFLSTHAVAMTLFDVSYNATSGPNGTGVIALDSDNNFVQFDWEFDGGLRGGFDTSFDYFSDGGADFLRDLILVQNIGDVGYFSTTPFLFGDLVPQFTVLSSSSMFYRFDDLSGALVSSGRFTLTARPVPVPAAAALLLSACGALVALRRR